jgi:aldose 1-epimerase
LEDQRMSSMYLGAVGRWFSSLFHRIWHRNLMRSGMVTGLFLALLVLGLSIAYRERGRGHLHKLEAKIVTERQDAPVPRPGGQEAIKLTRTSLAGGSMPEFLSVTMLPGRGMNVLQITAFLPDKGEVELLASPSVDDAARLMTGQDADAAGAASLTMGGAFEAPWAGHLAGTPSQDHITTAWRGHTMTVPVAGAGASVATGGLLLLPATSSADTAAMPDGGQAETTFQAGDFGAHWPSKTDINVTVLLSSQSIELTMVAHNTGDVAEPIGIGWHPRFAIRGDRGQIRLRLPGQVRAEVHDRQTGLPTGTLLPVAGTAYDFTPRGGQKLGNISLNDTFTQLHQELLDNGPVAQLDDPANNYGLRLTALSSTIKAMRVEAPADGKFVSIDPQFNFDDPFGREWGKDVDTGMVVLQPGQSTQWKVRLELVSLTPAQAPI